MPFTKIEAKDYDGKGVTGLPDIPRLDTLDMQKKFDELAKDVAIPKHNVLVDELSGETAADNLGIADDIADFSNPAKKIKPLLVAFAKKIKENSNDRHTHKNKTVLDNIADTAITAWNKVSNLFTNIDGVEDVVSGRTSKIPSSFAISQYVQQMGGGDMVKSIYDRNGNGIVDDAEALGGKAAGEYQTAESQELQTTSKTVVGAVNEVFNKTKDVLNTKEEIEANTDPTAIAGALSVKELSTDLKANGSQFHFDYHNGQWGFNTDPARGADTFIPFNHGLIALEQKYINAGASNIFVFSKTGVFTLIVMNAPGWGAHILSIISSDAKYEIEEEYHSTNSNGANARFVLKVNAKAGDNIAFKHGDSGGPGTNVIYILF